MLVEAMSLLLTSESTDKPQAETISLTRDGFGLIHE
jgi:hypothetical protein